MRKYMLLVTCSLLISGSASALTANEQLKALKDAYLKNFNQMDSNKDGQISKAEYLAYQFEDLRANIIGIDSFDDVDPASENTEENNTEKKMTPKDDKSLGMYSKTISEMANYDMNIDDELSQDLKLVDYEPLSKEDVMPDVLDEENLEILTTNPKEDVIEDEEDAKLDALISDTEKQISTLSEDAISQSEEKDDKKEETKDQETTEIKEESVKNTENKEEKTAQINSMLEEVKKTLPQKIDDVTTWTDIVYDNDIISYMYQADVDISVFSNEEQQILRDSIKTEACEEIYKSVCPQVIPIFIEKGTNLTVRYIDKNNTEISYCDLNKDTCAQ